MENDKIDGDCHALLAMTL